MELTPSVARAWPRWRPGLLAWALWALVMLGVPLAVWLKHLLAQAGRSDQAGSNVDTVIYLLAVVSAVTVGAVLASRRPRHPVGWLLLALGLWFTYGYATWVLLAWRGAPSAVGDAAKDVSVFVMAACIGFVLLLTPTGSLPSPRWRWWARVLAVAAVGGLVSSVVGPLAVRALAELLQVARYVAFVITGLAIPVGVASLVVRFRRARGLERQQLRWLAVGAAILRYRLYDLDRIISRTLAYGLLTLLLSGAYAGVALGLGQLLGRTSSLAVAVATLTVAAVFQPARRRIQRAVDRRFNRRRHDAAQTIQAFSARLRQQ